MSTNLSGNALTLNNTSLNGDTLHLVNDYYYVPDNCTAGVTTVILDGIECLCIATGVTIQGSNLTRIAIDKNHDLGYYQKYVGTYIEREHIKHIKYWRWGGYGTELGNTSQEVGYGLQNTIRCLANPVNYTKGNEYGNNTNPFMWMGVSDFRSSHSDKWFVPSAKELKIYVYNYMSKLKFDDTGGGNTDNYWSSSEKNNKNSYFVSFYSGNLSYFEKYRIAAVRLCRAF